MGASDFNTGVKISGTKDDVFKIIKVLLSYATEKREQYRKSRNCPYLMSIYISGENEFGLHKQVSDFTDDELMKFIESKNCVVCVEASGPYGVFGSLDDVEMFHEMAEAAPNAEFSGGMGGFDTGGDQAASFELKNGLMTCKYLYPHDEEWDEDEDYDEEDEWDDEEDFDELEEPEWDEEVIYDPIKKKNIKR